MRTCPTPRANRRRRPGLHLEQLEARELPAITIQIDYSYDTSGFFTNNPAARAVMQQVATQLGNTLSANLAAISPSGSNTWSETFYNPATGAQVSVANPTVGANTITVYVGARPISGTEAGGGGPGGYSLSGSSAWISTVQTRGHSGFSTWGGSIAFDSTENWFFGTTTAGLNSSQVDFMSAATHELGHVLGIGTSAQWTGLSQNGYFVGSSAEGVYGGPVPLSTDGAHWADGILINGQRTVMDPILPRGTRVAWSPLDAAGLRDLGWNTTTSTAQTSPAPSPPPPAAVTTTTTDPAQAVAFTGGTNGALLIYRMSGGTLVATGQQFTPFPGYRGELRVVSGDFNGDGVTDYAVSTGAGPQATIAILSGADGHYIVPPTALFPGYAGGLYLAAADIDGNGRDQLVVAAGINAPPYVAIYQVSGSALQIQYAFFAFNAPDWQGGIRIAAGDLNGDGYADVVVTTASQVAAVATYSGAALARGSAALLTPIAFPVPGLAVGLNVAIGDLNGDGHNDLVLSLERGGSAIAAVWSGAVLSANPTVPVSQLPMAALILALPANGGGGRLAMSDLNGDGRDELIVTDGGPQGRLARAFTYDQLLAGGAGAAYLVPLGSTPTVNGLYVG
ncbi:FG-GAP-like repeat-containing protein [Frigoriglobus tundricola]|uniref:Peptidase M10 metallopeptidase domain-containing protein n=1 Tax=Frigoriglobus tundricola TaxID=2774151 RepID=A0A6M5Z2L6_9BACT|nr:FG-GAP-like repeat-containing protein [Frigoriglobus tundricola]QJW99432.1 hypothetical protein FTUN_7044 [Frigoriglobus tundricola]